MGYDCQINVRRNHGEGSLRSREKGSQMVHRLRLTLLVVVIASLPWQGSIAGAVPNQGDAGRDADSAARFALQTDSESPIVWQYRTQAHRNLQIGWSQASVVNGDLVHAISGYGQVVTISAEDGSLVWSAETNTESILFTYMAANSNVLMVAAAAEMFAFDARTGDQLWVRQVETEDDVFPPPSMRNGLVYFSEYQGGDSSTIYAVEERTGREVWSIETGPVNLDQMTTSDQLVVVSDADGFLHGIDALSGERRWQVQPGGTVSIVGNIVFVQTRQGGEAFIALDGDSGREMWRFDDFAHLVASTDDRAFVGINFANDGSSLLLAVDLTTGEEIWRVRDLSVNTGIVVGGSLYVTGSETVFGTLSPIALALSVRSGNDRWRISLNASVGAGQPVYVDKMLFIASQRAVSVLDAREGTQVWRFNVGSNVGALLPTGLNTVILRAGDGAIYSLSPDRIAASSAGPISDREMSQRPELRHQYPEINPVPDEPYFLGLWRLSIEAGSEAVIPAFEGRANAYIFTGSLEFSTPVELDHIPVVPGEEGYSIAPEKGFYLPTGEELVAYNPSGGEAWLMIVAAVPLDAIPQSFDDGPLSLVFVGGGRVESLPIEFKVDNSIGVISAGDATTSTLRAFPTLILQTSGSIDYVSAPGAELPIRTDVDGAESTEVRNVLETGQTLFLPAGSQVALSNPSNEDSTFLLVEVRASFAAAEDAAGGCGGRCLGRFRP
jgi:outer membrane protein assembly factor BamB